MTLGIRHILSGYDHLVFLAGLILAACTVRELVVALTAFTAAHSLSLALVVVGGVHAPPSIVEPLIAASIAWVGVENLLRERSRSRWWVVFGFGLVHGFGFAGALLELGFGSSASGVALGAAVVQHRRRSRTARSRGSHAADRLGDSIATGVAGQADAGVLADDRDRGKLLAGRTPLVTSRRRYRVGVCSPCAASRSA